AASGGWQQLPAPPPHPVAPPRRRTGLIAAIVGGIVLLVAAGVVVGLLVIGHTTTSPGRPGAGSSATPSQSGVAYTDPQGRYSAVFAGRPAYHDTTTSTANGDVPYMYAE